jgi:hypothetical protein
MFLYCCHVTAHNPKRCLQASTPPALPAPLPLASPRRPPAPSRRCRGGGGGGGGGNQATTCKGGIRARAREKTWTLLVREREKTWTLHGRCWSRTLLVVAMRRQQQRWDRATSGRTRSRPEPAGWRCCSVDNTHTHTHTHTRTHAHARTRVHTHTVNLYLSRVR